MVEIHFWEYLAAIEKSRTLSEAAESLYVSQPALSRSMQKLEKIIGVELFTRKKNFIALNENGKIAAQLAKEILRQNCEAVEKIREFDRRNRTISIGACAPIPLNKIIFLITQYFPEATFSSELDNDEKLLEGLQEDFFNIVILHKNITDKNLFVKNFGGEKLFLAVPLNHKFADKDGIFLEELNGEKILLYSKIGFWYDLCKEKAPNAKFLMQSERDVFQELTATATFLSFTTDIFLNNGCAQNNCVYKPILNAEAEVNYYFVCKSNQIERFQKIFSDLQGELYEKVCLAV